MKKVMRNGREFEVYTAKEIAEHLQFDEKNMEYAPDQQSIDIEEQNDYYIFELWSHITSPYKAREFKLRPDDLVYLSIDKHGKFDTCELDSPEEKEIK